jgi:hypothetical protein
VINVCVPQNALSFSRSSRTDKSVIKDSAPWRWVGLINIEFVVGYFVLLFSLMTGRNEVVLIIQRVSPTFCLLIIQRVSPTFCLPIKWPHAQEMLTKCQRLCCNHVS